MQIFTRTSSKLAKLVLPMSIFWSMRTFTISNSNFWNLKAFSGILRSSFKSYKVLGIWCAITTTCLVCTAAVINIFSVSTSSQIFYIDLEIFCISFYHSVLTFIDLILKCKKRATVALNPNFETENVSAVDLISNNSHVSHVSHASLPIERSRRTESWGNLEYWRLEGLDRLQAQKEIEK